MLGERYYAGNGAPQSYGQALKWIRKAAENGVVNAQFSLAGMYYDGRGVSKNYEEAVNCLRLSQTLVYL